MSELKIEAGDSEKQAKKRKRREHRETATQQDREEQKEVARVATGPRPPGMCPCIRRISGDMWPTGRPFMTQDHCH